MRPLTDEDLRRLAKEPAQPAVSVLFSPKPRRNDNEGDELRLRTLVDDALDWLDDNVRTVEPEVLDGLRAATDGFDPAAPLAGMAMFATADSLNVFELPARVDNRLVLDNGFALRDAAWSLQRGESYRVLLLNQHKTRCIEVRDGLARELRRGFPVEARYAAEADTPHSDLPRHETDAAPFREEFRAVDAALAPVDRDDPLPLVLVGTDRDATWFREVARHSYEIAGSTRTHATKSTPEALKRLADPIIEAWHSARAEDLASELREAIGAGRATTGIFDCWRAARDGRARVLVAESNYRRSARCTDVGLVDIDVPNALDVVDHLAGAVLRHDGEVRFVDPGLLADLGHVALLLRY